MRWLARDLLLAHQCGVGMRVKARVRAWACMPVAGIGAGWRGRRDGHFGPDGLISQPQTGFGNMKQTLPKRITLFARCSCQRNLAHTFDDGG